MKQLLFLKLKKADFEVKFFTPEAEVDLCGHATIGLFSILFTLKMINNGKYKILTKAGILEIKLKKMDLFLWSKRLYIF